MATRKSATKGKQTQAQRLLDLARKAKQGTGSKFANDTGKAALVRNGRKAPRIG